MPHKVLIAHGDTHMLERAVRELTVAGFEVVATPDGGDAFARFFEEKPDLVVCSEALPVLDGRSFCNMIRSQEPDTPVVLLVADGTQEDGDEVLVLPEPLDIAQLRRLLPEADGPLRAAAAEAAPAEVEPCDEMHGLLLRFQRQGNLLALLDRAGLERLAALAELQERGGDACVIAEGDACDGFYLVIDGEVRVTIAERGDQEVARLGSGEFFGEMALLSEQPRSASVWSCGPTRLLFFEREAVLALLGDYPELREVLGGVALQRAEENLWQALADDDDVQNSLSELLDGVGESPAGGRPGVEKVEPGGRRVALPPVSGEPETAVRYAPEQTAAARLHNKAPLRWQALWLWPVRHQFESGLILGATGGILLIGALMLAFGGSEEVPVAPTPPAAERASEAEPVGATPRETVLGAGGVAVGPDSVVEPDDIEQPDAGAPVQPLARTGESPSPQNRKPLLPGRKALRSSMLAAYEKGAFSDAVKLGGELRDNYKLDWETQFVLAQAHRRVGDTSAALAEYLAFAEAYPANLYADDAQFWAAEILAERGQRSEAAELYRAVIANPKTNLKQRAARRLAAVAP